MKLEYLENNLSRRDEENRLLQVRVYSFASVPLMYVKLYIN